MWIGDEGGHADGFGKGFMIGRVDSPGFAKVGGVGDGAAVGV